MNQPQIPVTDSSDDESLTVICPAEGSGQPITAKEARDRFHYKGGDMAGKVVILHHTVHCLHCRNCLHPC